MTLLISEPIPEKTLDSILEHAGFEPIRNSGQGGGIHEEMSQKLYWDNPQIVETPTMKNDKNKRRTK